jgi:hypothetical protein
MRTLLDDLTPLNIERIEARMRPGAYSVSGFLDESDHLVTVVERDSAILARLGFTHREIADHLEFLVRRRSRMEDDRTIRETVVKDRNQRWVRGYEVAEGIIASKPSYYLGQQFCPFEIRDGTLCEERSSVDFWIYNAVEEKALMFSGLLIHLIGDHHFFEGSVPYRVDPQEIIEVAHVVRGATN